VVFHKRRTSIRKFFKQIFNWGIARINLGRQYPELLKTVHLLPAGLIALSLFIFVGSMFIPVLFWALLYILFGAVGVALFAFFQSYSMHRSIKIASLSVLTLFIQVIAYGLGSWSGLWQWLRGKSRAEGFTRNYYK
jgi:membrane protein DedA with SNARE-associated domain